MTPKQEEFVKELEALCQQHGEIVRLCFPTGLGGKEIEATIYFVDHNLIRRSISNGGTPERIQERT